MNYGVSGENKAKMKVFRSPSFSLSFSLDDLLIFLLFLLAYDSYDISLLHENVQQNAVIECFRKVKRDLPLYFRNRHDFQKNENSTIVSWKRNTFVDKFLLVLKTNMKALTLQNYIWISRLLNQGVPRVDFLSFGNSGDPLFQWNDKKINA